MTTGESYARITSLLVQDVFVSSEENELRADVGIVNDSNLAHSAQVVFRGYVRRGKTLVYEFLNEQVWIFIRPSESKTHTVAVEVWLPRFPPSMKIHGDINVEYSVRAEVDPWFQNSHVEKIFAVKRKLILKMPHVGCYQHRIKVNQCVDHGGWYHKKCKPMNGEIWIEKSVFSAGETVKISWQLQLDSKLEKVKLGLIQHIVYRNSAPDHPALHENFLQALATKEVTLREKEGSNCEIVVPSDLPVSMPMTLWNVLAIRYELLFQVKMEGHRPFVDFRVPLIITSEPVKSRNHTASTETKLFNRAQDIDDDTDDDDDQDSELEELQEDGNDYSIDIENLEITPDPDEKLSNACAKVVFTINSMEAKAVRSLRLLLQGEVRAGSFWYAFIRYKAHITSDGKSLFSPGQHNVSIPLPFNESQYDTNILPPSLGDDIRYICRVTTKSWSINDIAEEKDVFIDRKVDTWAKEKFKSPYTQIIGAYGIEMEQRAFQRGKHIFVKVLGSVRNVRLMLEQQRRLRRPGLNKDDSYCHERIVSSLDSPEEKGLWPERWALRIPRQVPPSIEITYWNVLFLSYALKIALTMEDGHEHTHTVPIWIGCTDDKLPPPTFPTMTGPLGERQPPPEPTMDQYQEPIPGEAPEFEVVETDANHYSPLWVNRYNEHMYS